MSNPEDTPIASNPQRTTTTNYGSAENRSRDTTLASSRASPRLFCLHGHSHVEVRDHCHRTRSEGVDVKARRKLIFASVLCLVFMIAEIVGGVLSNSLAIATDAAHLLTDFASFMISLFAIWIAGRPSTQRMSFGWYRAEVIGALASVFMIWVITGILVWLAVGRVISGDYDVDAKIMLITSGLAILVNVIMGVQLHHGHSHGFGGGDHGHGHSHSHKQGDAKQQKGACKNSGSAGEPCAASPTQRLEDGVAINLAMQCDDLQRFSYQNSDPEATHECTDAVTRADGEHGPEAAAAHDPVENMNVRAAFIHVLGDIIQSVGVFIAALVIFFWPQYAIVDPICTFVFSIIVLFTTFNIMKDALLVLMEGTPSYMHYEEVLRTFQGIEGVERVHNLRIWALSVSKIALSAHLAIAKNANPKRILEKATSAVHLRYNFFETTIQIEEYTEQMASCQQCTVPEK